MGGFNISRGRYRVKVLNLYAGIGGNRKLWTDCDVTAVENEPIIAKFYKERYPKDIVIVADAHQYLLDHYKEFDFIWSSIPCQSHSGLRRTSVYKGQNKAIYPDMKLYEEIIFLQNFAPLDTKWVVENVKPYYDYLIPGKEIGRHIVWSNFTIPYAEIENDCIPIEHIKSSSEVYGVKLPKNFGIRKDQVLRNMVNPKLGLYIFNEALKRKQPKQLQIKMEL
ncbi:MAG TPA: DNA cytosine methyltransferase [Williamwhitmania sp.]|nr:DNA cytosine methyltransferase [Williamwhitmania sp.]